MRKFANRYEAERDFLITLGKRGNIALAREVVKTARTNGSLPPDQYWSRLKAEYCAKALELLQKERDARENEERTEEVRESGTFDVLHEAPATQ